jgi:hypothetical protein
MHASSYVSLLVSGSADLYVQELVREAERSALIKAAKSGRRSVVQSLRLVIGQFMVGSGRKVAGRSRRRQRALDVPVAFKIAR